MENQTEWVNDEISEIDLSNIHHLQEDEYPPDIYTIEDFREQVKLGYFNDYDGSGYWATIDLTSRIPVDLSKLVKGESEPGFTHIEWFNK